MDYPDKRPPSGPRVALTTLGCKVNQYESSALAGEFAKRGYEVVPFSALADIYVINTCTVTGRSDYQARQLIRQASRRNPLAIVVATGCYAQVAPQEMASMPEVALIVGSAEKMSLPDRIETIVAGRCRVQVGNIAQVREMDFQAAPSFPGHTRAFLKIQDGCDACCSYCIVPRARGRSRSLPLPDVLEEIRRLGRSGYQEVVLTGIHLGAYGKDLTPAVDLLDILMIVEKELPVARVRLSSLEPGEVTDELIDFAAVSRIVCPHFHIPLQSGDDAVLSAMQRTYDSRFFRELIHKIRAKLPRAAIGIDVMTGFPGEDEAGFRNTFNLIEDLPVTYLHVFPYSKRPGTAAAIMAGQVGEKVKKERAEELRWLGTRKKGAFARSFVGTEITVLIEGREGKKREKMQGLTDNYLTVVIDRADPGLVNRLVTVLITDEENGQLRGRVIHA
jgi:threonylcarbamoyladenosine tRNA methylthiotransferase MtaB